jgi:hypothetical protein
MSNRSQGALAVLSMSVCCTIATVRIQSKFECKAGLAKTMVISKDWANKHEIH